MASSKVSKNPFIPIRDNLLEYEKMLAELEQIRYKEDPDNFYKETAYQKSVDGKISDYHIFSKINYGYKRLTEWGGYLSHGFDVYQGSIHAQMVRALINSCNFGPNAMILDPFYGSGTTLVESTLLGFLKIG